ncbi:TPA: hypothetical protein BOS_25355 [Bos taurus]|nr:TPA: hypothetical protein BOS_25355 [Bos taurus]
MESSEVEITDVEEPANTIETELSESSDSMDSFNVNPVMSDDFNTVSPLPSIPASSEMYSRQSFESERGMGHVTHVYELKHVHKVSVMDHTEESDKDVHENQEDQEYEENHEEVQKDWKDQENKKDQEDEEGQKEQEYQALPSIVGRVLSPDLLEPAPEKPRSEAMKSPFSDISEPTSVSGSCLPGSSQIHEELQQTFDTSSQVPIQEEVNQEQQQQLQQQQQQLLPLPEQPQQCNTTRENQEMQVFVPNQLSCSMLCYNDGFMPLPLPLRRPPPPPPMFIPTQMVAEQQPSGYYHAENLSASGYYRAESLNAPGYYLTENFNASGYYHAENFNGPENGRFRWHPLNKSSILQNWGLSKPGIMGRTS